MPRVPTRPVTQDEDYTLGGTPEWMNQFAQGTQNSRQEANALRGQGDRMGVAATAAQGRATPQTSFGRSQAVGGQETASADWLTDFANGPQGPSAAPAQLQEGSNQTMANSLALARSGSGFGEGANSIANAQRANADTMATTANQAAMLRAREDQAFRQQRLGAMGTAAGIYGNAAAREGDQAQFRTQAELEAAGQRDALQLGLGSQSIDAQNLGIQGGLDAQGQSLAAQQAQLQGNVARGQTDADLYGKETDVFKERLRRDEAKAAQRRANREEGAGYIAKGAAAIASVFSDERTKRNVKSADLRRRYEALSD